MIIKIGLSCRIKKHFKKLSWSLFVKNRFNQECFW